MKAIMYGAGNIGRGFIGALLSKSGYEVVFIDVNPEVVDAINREGGYHQEIVGEHPTVHWIDHVRAVDGRNADAVIDEIATADIMATSLGARVLPMVMPIIAKALTKRWSANPQHNLDLLICENLMDADRYIHGLLKDVLEAPYDTIMDTQLGLVETSIGRMVPVMTEEMKKGDPLRICVEAYDYLPVDKDALTGVLPDYDKLVPYSPFGYYLERKLYIHNMAHAMTAYLGGLQSVATIWEAIGDINVRYCVQSAMIESGMAVSQKYAIPYESIQSHIDDLLYRFTNRALGDTVARVGRDPLRKLAPSDRLIGAAKNCEAMGIMPAYLTLGIAACVLAQTRDNDETRDAMGILCEVCQLKPDDALVSRCLALITLLDQTELDWSEVMATIESQKAEGRGMIP